MWMKEKVITQIKQLDPVKDHQRIVFLSTCYEFPFDTTRALEFALFRTYCVPSISGLLQRTGEFCQRPQKRYNDTDLIVSELMEWGYSSERGQAALARMNKIHGHFAISNDDFVYVLSTFVFEPIRWNERFGWRKMCEQEKLAMYYFWKEVGQRMGILRIPTSYTEFLNFNIEYEQNQFHFSTTNSTIGAATRDLFASWFPPPLRPLVRQVIYAMLDESTIKAFGFPAPSVILQNLVNTGMGARARLIRLLPPRRRPRLRTQMRHRSYPRGYTLEQIGPPFMHKTAPNDE